MIYAGVLQSLFPVTIEIVMRLMTRLKYVDDDQKWILTILFNKPFDSAENAVIALQRPTGQFAVGQLNSVGGLLSCVLSAKHIYSNKRFRFPWHVILSWYHQRTTFINHMTIFFTWNIFKKHFIDRKLHLLIKCHQSMLLTFQIIMSQSAQSMTSGPFY